MPVSRAVSKKRCKCLVEPIEPVFQRLQETYAAFPRIRCEQLALSTEDGEVTLHRVSGSRSADPEWVNQLASFDREVIMRHSHLVEDLEERLATATVPSVTLGTLVSRCELSHIDLLHSDLEGFDDQAIQQIDFASEWAPRAILFEHRHLSDKQRTHVERLLSSNGYRVTAGEADTFARRT